MAKIRILIADDHAVVRSGLRLLINSQRDMEVVGEAKDGREVLPKVRESRPDIALLDLSMPGGGGLQAIGQLRREEPAVRVLVLTMHDDPDYLRSVLSAGGFGYVVKRSADSDLLSAIRTVSHGERFVDPSIGETLVQEILRDSGPGGTGGESEEARLSPREREVLGLLAHGYTNTEIAEKIFVSVKTVETYRARLSQKLGLRTRAELVRYAMSRGILRGDDDLAPAPR